MSNEKIYKKKNIEVNVYPKDVNDLAMQCAMAFQKKYKIPDKEMDTLFNAVGILWLKNALSK